MSPMERTLAWFRERGRAPRIWSMSRGELLSVEETMEGVAWQPRLIA